METDKTEPQALLEQLFNAFEEERWNKYPEMIAEDVVAHVNGEEILGLEELLEFEKDYKQSNPDAAVTVKEMATSENTVFSREVVPGVGTHFTCAHVDDGKIAEIWVLTE